jgi:hypothetical protein
VPKPTVDFDDSVNAHGGMDYPTLSPLMFDLLFLAIQSDSSRVFTAGFGMHNHVIEIDGVGTGYHGLTHHGNLLDETMVFFGSGLGDASRHSNRDLPIILAGGGFKHGSHVNAMQRNKVQTPLNNLFTAMLRKFGVEIDRFSNATGTISL